MSPTDILGITFCLMVGVEENGLDIGSLYGKPIKLWFLKSILFTFVDEKQNNKRNNTICM